METCKGILPLPHSVACCGEMRGGMGQEKRQRVARKLRLQASEELAITKFWKIIKS